MGRLGREGGEARRSTMGWRSVGTLGGSVLAFALGLGLLPGNVAVRDAYG